MNTKTSIILATILMLLPLAESQVNKSYDDNIIWIYNETCIETTTWQYLYLNNTNIDLNNFDSYDNVDIRVVDLKVLNKESVIADIYF
jgi:hypothetical protein